MNNNETQQINPHTLSEAEFFQHISDHYTADIERGILYHPSGREITARKNGWIYTTYQGRQFYVHRFLLFLRTGYLGIVTDHIDRNRANNSASNLRWTNHYNSAQNRDNSKPGYETVTNSHGETRYLVRVRSGNIYKSLGQFNTVEEALAARQQYLDYFKH